MGWDKTLGDYVHGRTLRSPIGKCFIDSRTSRHYTLLDRLSDKIEIELDDGFGPICFVPLEEHTNDKRYTLGMAIQDGVIQLAERLLFGNQLNYKS